MADGGASSFIMLVTALLISGSASAIIISEWGKAADVVQNSERKSSLASGVSVAFAGDPAMVAYDDSTNPHELTFYVLNSGETEMSDVYTVLVDGVSPSSMSETILPSGTAWLPGYLLEVTVADASFGYGDSDDVTIYFIGQSESVDGYSFSASMSKEVRLHVA